MNFDNSLENKPTKEYQKKYKEKVHLKLFLDLLPPEIQRILNNPKDSETPDFIFEKDIGIEHTELIIEYEKPWYSARDKLLQDLTKLNQNSHDEYYVVYLSFDKNIPIDLKNTFTIEKFINERIKSKESNTPLPNGITGIDVTSYQKQVKDKNNRIVTGIECLTSEISYLKDPTKLIELSIKKKETKKYTTKETWLLIVENGLDFSSWFNSKKMKSLFYTNRFKKIYYLSLSRTPYKLIELKISSTEII